MRLSRVAIATATMVLILGGCGVADSGGGKQDLSKDKVTLRMTWWGGDARHELTKKAIAAFQAKYPNITVTGEFSDWNGYWDKLATATAGGNIPDVIQMDQTYLASYADRGVLADLAQQPELDTKALPAAVLDTGRSKGVLYAMPISTTSWGLLINQDKLTSLGLTLPDTDTWTWSEFATFAESVTKASGGKVHGVTPWSNEFSLQLYARQHGESLYTDGKVTITAATMAGYLKQAKDWADSGASQSASQFAEQASAALDQMDFSTGKVAMIFSNITQLTAYAKAAGGADIVAAKLPTDDRNATKYSYLKPGMYWSVASAGKHRAEAEQLVNFLVNSPEAGQIFGTERGIPANPFVLDSIKSTLKPDEQKTVAYTDSIQNILGPAPALTPNGASDIDKFILRALQDVMFGRQPADAAAKSFISQLQSSIDTAK